MWKTIALTLLNRAMPLLIGELWQFIQDSVATYENAGLTGAQKREAVLQDAQAHCLRVGAAISDSLINLGIESAVQLVRSRTGA